MSARVKGVCPMGCGHTLILGNGGYITCTYSQCPNPVAVTKLLTDSETEHIVEFFTGNSFTVRHPLRERASSDLFHCPIHSRIASLSPEQRQPGRFRIAWDDRAEFFSWDWTALAAEPAGHA